MIVDTTGNKLLMRKTTILALLLMCFSTSFGQDFTTIKELRKLLCNTWQMSSVVAFDTYLKFNKEEDGVNTISFSKKGEVTVIDSINELNVKGTWTYDFESHLLKISDLKEENSDKVRVEAAEYKITIADNTKLTLERVKGGFPATYTYTIVTK